MDVLISGAGVGGLALANGLQAAGHGVRVFERASRLRTGGAAVTIFSNGAAAASGLGVKLDDLGGLIEELTFRTADGVTFGRTDLRVLHRRTGFRVATVPRDRLLARLSEHLRAGTVEYDQDVVAAGTADGQAFVTDATGATHTAQVVVGADGYRSAVRQSIIKDHSAVGTGWVSWQGLTVTLPDLANGTHAFCFVGTAGLCGLMPAGDGLLQWWFDVPDSPAVDSDSVTGWLRDRFAHYAEPVPELLNTITDADIQAYPHVLHRVPDQWGTGPTTLLGDAAHAFPPSQAQGANQALEDAWLLNRALRQPGDPSDLLRRYERRRSPRVRRVSRLAASEITNRPPTPLGRLFGKILTPALSGHAYLALIRRFSSVLHNETP